MRYFLTVIFTVLIAACSTIEPLPVPRTTGPSQVPEGLGPASPTLQFASITKNIPVGERTSVIGSGFVCNLLSEQKSTQSPYKDTFVKRVAIAVHEVLKDAKYNVVGDPNDPFSQAIATNADYLLGAKVLDSKSSICYQLKKYSGQRYYRIEWSLMKRAEKQVVFSSATDGFAEAPEAIEDGANKITYDALKMSLRKVLADPKFAAAIR